MSTCKECKFWDITADGTGWCRRFPPTPLESTDPPDYPVFAALAETDEDDWCGEWAPREESDGK